MKHITIILIALTLITGSLFAQGSVNNKKMAAPRTPNENPKFVDRLTPMDAPMSLKDKMNFTDKQSAKMEELKLNLQKQMNTMQAQIDNLKLDKQNAMKAENFSQAKKLNGQIFDLHKEMSNARIDNMQAMLKELTEDQKAILKEHCEMGRGMGGGGMMMWGNGMRNNRKGMHRGFHNPHMGGGMRKRSRDPNSEDCQANNSDQSKDNQKANNTQSDK